VRLDRKEIGTAFYGLQSMSSDHEEVRTLLSILAIKITDCREIIEGTSLSCTLYGLQGMTSDSPEVRTILQVLTDNIAGKMVRLDLMNVANSVYGMQGMNCEHTEVRSLFSALQPSIIECLDQNVRTCNDDDIVNILRTFELFHAHMVTILGSESLCSDYFHKFTNELLFRKERMDEFFAQRPCQSDYELDVYYCVAALEKELQLKDLRNNVSLLNCFEGDITFVVTHETNGQEMMVNVEADGMFHELKRRKTFCRLRDQTLMSKGIYVVRINSKDFEEVDDILRKTVQHVRSLLEEKGNALKQGKGKGVE